MATKKKQVISFLAQIPYWIGMALIWVFKKLFWLVGKIFEALKPLFKLGLKKFNRLKPKQKMIFGLVTVILITTGFLTLNFTKNKTPTADQQTTFQKNLIGKWDYTTKENQTGIKTKLSKNKAGLLVQVLREKSQLEFALPLENPSLVVADNKASYFNKDESIEVTYEVQPDRLKESIILHKPTSQTSFTSNILLKNLTIKLSKQENLPVFFDTKNNYQFHLERPFAIDAAGKQTFAVSYRFEPKTTGIKTNPFEQKNNPANLVNPQVPKGNLLDSSLQDVTITTNEYDLIITVDQAWLKDPARQYPIVIDPTVVHDTTAEFATGEFNRLIDTGSGSSPVLETYYQELPADERTMGLWHMNESSDNGCSGGEDICDVSGNGNHATFTNDATRSSTALLGDYSTTFDGTTDYLNFGSMAMSSLNEITISFWVKREDAGGTNQFVFSSQHSGADDIRISLNSSNTVSAVFDDGVEDGITGTQVITNDGTWHHIAVTQSNDSGQVILYIDGKNDGQDSGSSFGYSGMADVTYMGERTVGASSDEYNGEIDELRIDKIVRTPEEIKAMASRKPYAVYTSPVVDFTNTILTWNPLTWTEAGVATGDGETVYDNTNLVAQWNFNETSGTTADNAEGTAALDGTVTSMTTSGQDAAAGDGWTANNKKWGAGALMFDFVDGYVTIPDHVNLDLDSAVTLEAWVKADSLNGSGMMVVAKRSGTTTNYEIDIENDDVRFVFYNAGWKVYKTSGISINPGEWYHLVATYDEVEAHIYVNGKEAEASWTTGGVSALVTNSIAVQIGTQSSGSNLFDGVMDSVKIYSSALSATEILSNYNASNLQFQTRVGSTSTPNDGGWDTWSPTTNETQVLSLNADAANWVWDNLADSRVLTDSDETVIKQEASGSLKIELGEIQTSPSPVGLWHFDETNGDNAGADIFDSHTNNLDFEIYGSNLATGTINGIIGKARDFNGTNDYLYKASSSFDLANHTTMFWIKVEDDTVSQWVMTPTNAGSGRAFGFINAASDGNSMGIGHFLRTGTTSGTNVISGYTTTYPIEAGEWYHVASLMGSGGNKIYIDGEEMAVSYSVGSASTANAWDDLASGGGAQQLYIGTYQYDGAGHNWFGGALDDLAIYNSKLNAEDIAEIYRLGRDHHLNKTITSEDLSDDNMISFDVAADRPGTYLELTIGESDFANYQADANTAGLWHLDEKSDDACDNGTNDSCDASGNNNHGDVTSAPPIVQGVRGKARNFDGSADYIKIPDSASLDVTTTFTLSGWIKLGSTKSSGEGAIVSKGAWDAWKYYLAVNQADDTIRFRTRQQTPYDLNTTDTLERGVWNHVVGVHDNGTKYVYINGKLSATNTVTGSITADTNPVCISGLASGTSCATGTHILEGDLDEVRIDNVARTATEIRQAYEIGRRSHPITIDFAADLDSGNLISGSGDTSFTVDATAYGLEQKGDAIYTGDKIIIKETDDDTEYTAQGTVTAVTASTGAITVDSWQSGSTFPSAGYTANASVFKWQKEYFDLSDVLDEHRDATTELSLRITNGHEGRTVWLDDIRSAGDYLTTDTGSTITSSTGNRYLQYRAVFSSSDEFVSSLLSVVTLDYTDSSVTEDLDGDPTACYLSESRLDDQIAVHWTDNSTNEISFEIEKKTNGGSWATLDLTSPNAQTYNDNGVSQGDTYAYRIRGRTGDSTGDWCITSTVDLSAGNFKFEGLQIEGVRID